MTWRNVQLEHDDDELFTSEPHLDVFLDSRRDGSRAKIADEIAEWAKETYLFALNRRDEELPKQSLMDMMTVPIRQWPPFKNLGIEVKERTRCAKLLSQVVIDQEWDSISKQTEG